MKAGSAPRVAARRALTAIAVTTVAAGCGGTGSSSDNDALRGVDAHRLADAPARNRPADTAGRGRTADRASNRRISPPDPHRVISRRLTVRRDGLHGRWYAPRELHSRMPAVVAFGGSDGGLTTTPFARALASDGYPALALAYFKEPGLPKQLRRIPLEYFARAVRFAARQPGADPQRIAVLGISRGGEAALLVASTYPNLVHGVIALVPDYQTNAGWTLRGKEVRFDELIRVERIRGPVLTASGGRDEVWSSSVYTEQIEQRLTHYRFAFPHERLNFPDAGHGLRRTAPVLWPRILRLLRRLREAPPAPARGS